jgi:hemin uptake protein HemP
MTDSLPRSIPSGPIPPTPAASAPPPTEPRSVESTELFQGARVVEITHAGETYRLLLTRNNRLILQK